MKNEMRQPFRDDYAGEKTSTRIIGVTIILRWQLQTAVET